MLALLGSLKKPTEEELENILSIVIHKNKTILFDTVYFLNYVLSFCKYKDSIKIFISLRSPFLKLGNKDREIL